MQRPSGIRGSRLSNLLQTGQRIVERLLCTNIEIPHAMPVSAASRPAIAVLFIC